MQLEEGNEIVPQGSGGLGPGLGGGFGDAPGYSGEGGVWTPTDSNYTPIEPMLSGDYLMKNGLMDESGPRIPGRPSKLAGAMGTAFKKAELNRKSVVLDKTVTAVRGMVTAGCELLKQCGVKEKAH